jgi:hypothetical protein
MRLRRYLLVVGFAVVCAISASAGSVDVGGTFFNLTGVGNSSGASPVPGGSPGLVQEDVLKGWVQAAFNDNLSLNIQVDGTFNTAPVLPFNTLLLYANADLLNLHGSYQLNGALRQMQFTVGRLMLSDFSTRVLSHEADGLLLDIEFPGLSLNIASGYTGLVTKGASTIELSKSDLNDYTNTGVNFASPRVVEMVQATVLLLPGQRIAISGIAQQDLRGTFLDLAEGSAESLVSSGSTTDEPAEGGHVNTQYVGLGVSGNITGNLYYDVFSYLETGQMLSYQSGSYQSIFFYAALAGGGVRIFLPRALSSVIGVRGLYASGDPNAGTVVEGQSQGFSVFTPISRPTLDNVFSPQLSNVVVAEASYSLKPMGKLQAGAQADAYFRPTTGAISEPGLAPGSSSAYLGSEMDLAVNFTPLSDLGSSLWGGVFVPGTAFASGAGVQFKTGLNVMVNF